jgi:short-subunit dehydrogenase
MSKGDTVLITGASSGIGRAFAHLFAADGFGLVLTARRESTLEALAVELGAKYRVPVRIHLADLSSNDGADLLHADLLRAGVQVDVLVNNAGVGMQGNFVELALDQQLHMMTLNMTSLTILTRLFVPPMIQRRRGGVLNVASIAGFQPGPLMAVYYATKAFVLSFSEALGDELSGTGVTVTCLAPGPTDTGFADAAGLTHAALFQGDVMTAKDVARIGYEGWKRGDSLVIAGSGNRLRQLVVKFAPRSFIRKRVRQLNTKTQ